MSLAPEPAASGGRLRGVLREPLLHFLIIGVLLTLGMGLARSAQRPVLRIEGEELAQLANYWEVQAQRPPSPQELQAILRERIDEELLAREAVRLGLDRDDIIIRRRLAQKVAFANEDLSVAKAPDEAALKALYAAAPGRFAQPGRMALRQVFFSTERRSGDAQAAAAKALSHAQAGAGDVAGDPSILPSTYGEVTALDLGRDFGPAFEAAAVRAPVGQWAGPVASPYGWHILRVEARRATEVPPFETVRDEVRDAWLEQTREDGNKAYMESLRRRYRVVIDR